MLAVRDISLISLLLRDGDVHPNPGQSFRIAAKLNILGFTPGKHKKTTHRSASFRGLHPAQNGIEASFDDRIHALLEVIKTAIDET